MAMTAPMHSEAFLIFALIPGSRMTRTKLTSSPSALCLNDLPQGIRLQGC